jgi:hypothetical protein
MTTYCPDPINAPYPTRTELTNLHGEYKQAYDDAKGGDSAAIALRKIKRAELEAKFKSIATLIVETAKAAQNPQILNDSGFPVAQSVHGNVTPAMLGAPTNVKLKQGVASGSAVASATAPAGAGAAEAQMCTADPAVEANWKTVALVKAWRHIDIAGITPGTMIHIRIRGIGPHGPGVWSDYVNLMVI